MSIEGVKFCDLCGGVIGRYDIAPVRVDEGGHSIQLHLHNRHDNDCLTEQLKQWAEEYANAALAAVSNATVPEPVQNEA
jgi:hypothetical protein